jgi:hypothetical protein
MRTILPCPEAPSKGVVSTGKKTDKPLVDEILIETIHQSAIRIVWPGGAWANFMEDGSLLSRSINVSNEDIVEAQKVLPDMKDITTQRRAFRALLREEMKKVEKDQRVHSHGRGHSKFIGGCKKSTWDYLAEELKALGYQTVKVWEPWCQQRGCDTRNWCLWPPTLLSEKEYVATN